MLVTDFITYAHRMADEAERQAAECSNGQEKSRTAGYRGKTAESYRKIHRRLSIRRYRWYGSSRWHSISEAPTTACGFGRFDQYMYPFYKADLEAGRNTKEEMLEMLECFYLKACEVYEVRDRWYAKSFAGYPMWEILVVGGQTPDGKDATNELSYLCLDAAADLQTKQPVLAVMSL